MSPLPLSADLVKATTGQYAIPIWNIYTEAWQRIKGMKKSFWGAFAILVLILVGIYVLFQFILSVCALFQALTLQSILQFIAGGFFESVRLLLSISLVVLALQHVRHQPLQASNVFEFSKAWKPLTCIAFSFYVLNFIFLKSSSVLLTHFNAPGLETTYVFGIGLQFIVFLFLFTYIALFVSMSMLLILDKKMQLKRSLGVAFKAINQHLFKNIALLLLASLLFISLSFITLGIGWIWLFPFMTLISAIQYQRIFCQSEFAENSRAKRS